MNKKIIEQLKEYIQFNIEMCEDILANPNCNIERTTIVLNVHLDYLEKIKELEGGQNE